jgi:hypothetical protein
LAAALLAMSGLSASAPALASVVGDPSGPAQTCVTLPAADDPLRIGARRKEVGFEIALNGNKLTVTVTPKEKGCKVTKIEFQPAAKLLEKEGIVAKVTIGQDGTATYEYDYDAYIKGGGKNSSVVIELIVTLNCNGVEQELKKFEFVFQVAPPKTPTVEFLDR